MFTSRAEYRLLFNHGSAELRLLEHAKIHKLLSNNRIKNIEAKKASIYRWIQHLETHRSNGQFWGDLIRRGTAVDLPIELQNESAAVRDEVLYRVTYRGYLERELRQVDKLSNVEKIRIPATLDFMSIRGLRRESALKLAQFKPYTLGQASRISGVNPADISILMILIEAGRGATSPQKEPPFP